jgi:hypothetical protein
MVGASCTAELIQDDPGGLARGAGPAGAGGPARAAGLPAQGKLGRGETFYQMVRALRGRPPIERHGRSPRKPGAPSCNLLGPTAWAFGTATTCVEISGCSGAWASTSTWSRPWAPPRRPGAARATRTSTWCSTRRSPTAPAARLAGAPSAAHVSTVVPHRGRRDPRLHRGGRPQLAGVDPAPVWRIATLRPPGTRGRSTPPT